MKKYYIVDQNFFRSDELKQKIEECKKINFVIPDVALLEMFKSEKWEETMRGSLSILSSHPTRTHMAICIGDGIRHETTQWKSISGNLLNKNFTTFLRDLLHCVNTGKSSAYLEKIRDQHKNTVESLAQSELNHEGNKSRLEKLIKSLHKILSEEFIKGIRSNKITREERLTLIKQIAPRLMGEYFELQVISTEKSKFFLKKKPLLIRIMYLKIWLCLDWISKGGFESVRDEKITNDLLDHNYVAIASFFDGILSREVRVNEAYEDLKWMLNARC